MGLSIIQYESVALRLTVAAWFDSAGSGASTIYALA